MNVSHDQLWQRIAPLSARLRQHVRVHVHHYRGARWFILEDRVTNRHHRLDERAYRFVRCLDGERSVAEVEQSLCADAGPGAPSREELVELLVQLHAAELMDSGLPASVEELFERHEKQSSGRRRGVLMSPISVRVPLFDPDRLLSRLAPAAGWMFSAPGLAAWLILVAAGLIVAVGQSPELIEHWDSRALAPTNLALVWLLYPPVKALHELGHGLAVKRWGGAVHETGVVLIVLTPVPYVDASAASTFASKHRRIAVSSAGIMVELALASLAILAWQALEPGLLRDAAFDVAAIGAVSTLLFNGNPLLRFDGYYMLADAVDIPNLATRSGRYLGYFARRHLLGVADARSPVTARGERTWFVVYGLLAATYRVVVLLSISLYLAGKLFVIGVLLAIWTLVAQVGVPLLRQARYLLASGELEGRRASALARCAVVFVVLVALLTLAPMPASTTVEGVVRVAEGAQLRAGADGFVRRVHLRDAASVNAGQAVLELEDPLLPAEIRRLEWRVAEIDRQRTRAWMESPVLAEPFDTELEAARAELAEARERQAALAVLAPVDGRVVLPGDVDLEGRFVRKGELLGHVAGQGPAQARFVVTQADVARVREANVRVLVRPTSWPDLALYARIMREVPAATDTLPSAALGTRGGGRIAVDGADAGRTRTLEPVFSFDLELSPSETRLRPGSRLQVRIDHGAESIADQIGRRVRQLLLANLAV